MKLANNKTRFRHRTYRSLARANQRLKFNNLGRLNWFRHRSLFQLSVVSEPGQLYSRPRMGAESIAYEAEGRMGYWLRGKSIQLNNIATEF